ncbi:MAG: hypothetical protein V3W34_02335, partial [Phycisphaerae bacterium]
MMMKNWLVVSITLSAAVGLGPVAVAQDSVSREACLPGDAVSPWADAQTFNGSEQCDAYVVDLTEFATSWGTTFGIAPVAKSSKSGNDFFGSLLSAQGISRDQLDNVVFPSTTYMQWSDVGFGINNDPALSNAGTPIDVAGLLGIQKAAAFSEFATTSQGSTYNGVVGMYINVLPTEPTRLYIQRIQAAVNNCDPAASMGDIGFGSVEASGSLDFRSDCFSCGGNTCDLSPMVGNNVFLVDIGARDCDILNVISEDCPGGLCDVGATQRPVCNGDTVYNTPGIMPASSTGDAPLYIGTNFSTEYARGTTCPPTLDESHLVGSGLNDHRGGVSYTVRNCDVVHSTHGMAAMLTKATGLTDSMLVWGLDADGNVTGNIPLTLPEDVWDNSDDFKSLSDPTVPSTVDMEFNGYHSQTAFRGGNGQVAVGVDPNGNLLAAGQVDHPFNSNGGNINCPNDWDLNFIAVVRVDCETEDIEWTMAGYNNLSPEIPGGGPGKAILDGPGGNRIGEMVPINGDGTCGGPSVTMPMIDAGGNVWFVSAIHLDSDPDPNSIIRALLRAVYDADTFSYELELVMTRFDVFHGQNSNRDYSVTFIDLADNDSVSSGAVWSQNVTGPAHMNLDPAGLNAVDPRTLGGLVIGVEITYDVDQDGDFEQCTDFEGLDQDYNVLLYIGSIEPLPACTEAGACDDRDVCTINKCDQGLCRVEARDYGDVNDDAEVDVFDIMCVLDASQSEFSQSCVLGNADLDPCEQDQEVNEDDITAMQSAFGGVDPCCAPPAGACCTVEVCDSPVTVEECELSGGEYQGDGTDCASIGECPPTGACCTVDECIDDLSQGGCKRRNGTYQGDDTACTALTCPDIGACCIQGVCNDFVAVPDCAAAGGLFQGQASLCEATECPTGACCLAGVCSDQTVEAQCLSSGGEYQGDDTACTTECPAPPAVTINEIRNDHVGNPDVDEYFELAGPPAAVLSGLTYLVIGDGIGGSGVIEAVVDLTGQTIPASGFFLAAQPGRTLPGIPDMLANLNFENSDNV